MLTLKTYHRTFLYTILHFVVDGICAAIVFSKLYTEEYTTCLIVFLLYNFLAFLSQPFVGALMDRFYKPKLFLGVAGIFLSLGFLFHFQFVISSICLGIGNSFFHICGGKDVIRKTKNDIISLGIFVSTGAIGLMLGQRYYSDALLISFYSIFFIGSLMLFLSKAEEEYQVQPIAAPKIKYRTLLLCLVVFVVAIRSFVGKIVVLDFEVTTWVFVGMAVSQALGKMIGGIAAKHLGARTTIIISMAIAILYLCIWNNSPYTICAGIFFFNFSMPITLYYANQLLKGKEGLAFGLLAAALIPGYLLGMLEYTPLFAQISIAVLCFISVVLIIIVEWRGCKNGAL